MNRTQKENYVKLWLQVYGGRDIDGFYTTIKVSDKLEWRLHLGYYIDEDFDETTPFVWCHSYFKSQDNNLLNDRTNEELDDIINSLETFKSLNIIIN